MVKVTLSLSGSLYTVYTTQEGANNLQYLREHEHCSPGHAAEYHRYQMRLLSAHRSRKAKKAAEQLTFGL